MNNRRIFPRDFPHHVVNVTEHCAKNGFLFKTSSQEMLQQNVTRKKLEITAFNTGGIFIVSYLHNETRKH